MDRCWLVNLVWHHLGRSIGSAKAEIFAMKTIGGAIRMKRSIMTVAAAAAGLLGGPGRDGSKN